mmetsp:Transcript_38779/g.82395  ORF Transcript_38779/g.82395 Transcript_38779/m.82395 type:complete len:208 (-) Transcript_38779:1967-2590(-)
MASLTCLSNSLIFGSPLIAFKFNLSCKLCTTSSPCGRGSFKSCGTSANSVGKLFMKSKMPGASLSSKSLNTSVQTRSKEVPSSLAIAPSRDCCKASSSSVAAATLLADSTNFRLASNSSLRKAAARCRSKSCFSVDNVSGFWAESSCMNSNFKFLTTSSFRSQQACCPSKSCCAISQSTIARPSAATPHSLLKICVFSDVCSASSTK